MADNRGVIFGDYFLNYELFEPIFIEWYSQKRDDFKNALETEVIAPIEQMIVIENNKVVSKHGAAVRKADYDAAKIYNAWERLSQEYFGNSPVTLIVGALSAVPSPIVILGAKATLLTLITPLDSVTLDTNSPVTAESV